MSKLLKYSGDIKKALRTTRTINIKDGELIKININGATEMLLLRRDSYKSIFINRFVGEDYSVDTSLAAVSFTKEHEENNE